MRSKIIFPCHVAFVAKLEGPLSRNTSPVICPGSTLSSSIFQLDIWCAHAAISSTPVVPHAKVTMPMLDRVKTMDFAGEMFLKFYRAYDSRGAIWHFFFEPTATTLLF